uniref:Uncharacterized protein n=1 Tax=Rhizophora mucronata TaxID=61149 RepID=A0A2P2QVC1_RHIMU
MQGSLVDVSAWMIPCVHLVQENYSTANSHMMSLNVHSCCFTLCGYCIEVCLCCQ